VVDFTSQPAAILCVSPGPARRPDWQARTYLVGRAVAQYQ